VFPDNKIEEAVVVATRFEILGDVGNSQKDEFLKSGQERLITSLNEYGWKIIYNKDSGVWTLTNENDSNFLIDLDEASEEIIIKDWSQNLIELTSNGIEITDTNGNNITLSSTGVNMTDANGNTIVGSSTGVTINDNLEVLQ
jgi:hypothetical protein